MYPEKFRIFNIWKIRVLHICFSLDMVLLLLLDRVRNVLLFMLVISIRTNFYFDFLKKYFRRHSLQLSMKSLKFCCFHCQIVYYYTSNEAVPLSVSIEALLIVFLFVMCWTCLDNVEFCTLKLAWCLYFSTWKYKVIVIFYYYLNDNSNLPSIVNDDCIEKIESMIEKNSSLNNYQLKRKIPS